MIISSFTVAVWPTSRVAIWRASRVALWRASRFLWWHFLSLSLFNLFLRILSLSANRAAGTYLCLLRSRSFLKYSSLFFSFKRSRYARCISARLFRFFTNPDDSEKKSKKKSGVVLDCINSWSLHPYLLLFDLILYFPSTIFQLNRDRSSWVEPVLS